MFLFDYREKLRGRVVQVELTSMVVSIVLTIIVLILTIITITKGYGYKHKVDPLIDPIPEENEHDDKQKIS